MDREESNEFLISQRIEGVRLLRMEEREKILQKIKNTRIKALRRLAHQRNINDPVLSDGVRKDIINDFFDRGSSVYAPVKRAGKNPAPRPDLFDVSSRTVPLVNNLTFYTVILILFLSIVILFLRKYSTGCRTILEIYSVWSTQFPRI